MSGPFSDRPTIRPELQENARRPLRTLLRMGSVTCRDILSIRVVAQTETMFSGFYGLGITFLLDGQGVVTHLAEMHVSVDYRFIPVK